MRQFSRFSKMTTALSSNPRKLVQVEKKANVIQRTTSETIRLGESELIVTNCVRFVPGNNAATTRKKTPTNAAGGSFQITAVCLTRGDAGDDSADDLDESHTDDISRITDNETPSISEDSRDPDYFFPNVFPETQHLPPIIAPEEEIIKIIEIESPLKIRGRWTCLDYDDKKNNKDDQIADFRSSSILNCDVHIGQKVYEVLLPESSSTGVENNYLLDVAALLSTTSIAEASSKTPENCSKAIDTKIEQAMDLVKSHLMVLVRQDVEILKVKITELLGRIKQLETENSYLRANAAPNVLHTLPLKSGEKPAIQAPSTKIICQQNQPNHCSQIIPQNSIKQLCQNHQTQCQPTQQNYQPQNQPNYVPIPQNQTSQQITNQPAQYINQPLQQNNYIVPQVVNQNIKPIPQNQLPIQIIQPIQQNNQPMLINNHPVVLNNQTFQNNFTPIQQNNQPIQTTVVPIQNNYALQQNQLINRSNQTVVQQNNYNIQPNQHIVRQSQFQIQQTYQPNNSVTTPVVYQTIQAYPQAR